MQASLTHSAIGDVADLNPLDAALKALPEMARRLMDADYAAVTVLNSEDRVEHMFYAGIGEEEAEAIGPPPTGRGVLGRLGTGGSVLRLERIADHENSVGFPAHHPPMQSLIGVRVANEQDRRANLYVANGPGKPPFTADDEVTLSTLAGYVTLALENARLYTEEAGLREQAQIAEHRLEAVIRGSQAGVVVVDATTREMVYASAEARRMTNEPLRQGSRLDSLESLGSYEDSNGSQIRSEDLPLSRALATQQPVGPQELTLVRSDGRRIPMLVSAAPVFAADGTPDTAVSVFLDMTRVKEVDQVKDDFLSMVTHDLRSPLATIKGLNAAAIGAFREGSRDEVRGLLESMDEEADYLTELVSNLLDMSRIEAGADIFDFELCHLADVSHDIVARLRRSREGRGRDIHLNVPASLPPVFADPAQIGRVVANLMSNALKYSDGDIEVTASFDPERRRIRVEIKDRGPGIPEDQQSIIFDKFGRLKTGKTRGREGSGLGLAICKSIVESHHGEIGVISVPGRGSTFWFDVPAEPDGK